MLTFYSEDTKKRRATTELYGGQLVSPFESAERVDRVIERVRHAALGEIRAPKAYDMAPVRAVHDARYLEFLERAWDDWVAAGFAGEAIPSVWPARRMRGDVVPEFIEGKVGYYALAAETSLDSGTFAAATASKDIALSALDHVLASGEPAFGLCRPPGHHAARDQYGGYCFFNNAAIAAERALASGIHKVAIVDIDFHHGNGTQDIFYDRDDVLFVSLHGDPNQAFPHFLGFADETGTGRGMGFNVNYPMPEGSDYSRWSAALDDAIRRIESYGAELVIVSLGVDTFKADPISFFCLASDDFIACGSRIKALARPTVFLLEGGYAVAEIGVNAVNVLSGFDNA